MNIFRENGMEAIVASTSLSRERVESVIATFHHWLGGTLYLVHKRNDGPLSHNDDTM